MSGTALAQEQIAPPYQGAPIAQQPPPVLAAPPPPEGAAYAPASSEGYSYATYVGGVPYPYLYTPSYGWSWYAPAWGAGRYHYGARIAHPGRAVGWRGGWGAHPHAAARPGGGHFHRR